MRKQRQNQHEQLQSPLKIGISSCLLGNQVRFDGGHKRSDFCTRELADHAEFIDFCPEMAAGMSTPRPTIRLEEEDGNIIVRASDGQDHTQALVAASAKQVDTLDGLDAYILCAKSPSCGMERVRVYKPGTNDNRKDGMGIFAQRLMEKYPLLPVEENGRLNDPRLRENFITRVYAYQRWQQINQDGLTAKALLDFHSRYKYLLMAHSQPTYRAVGPILSNLSEDLEAKAEQYITLFMEGMKKIASRKNHTNVLLHMQGYFKKKLSSRQRQELANLIHNYRTGLMPLLAPVTMIQHYLAEHPDPYIEKQYYLQPHPESFRLRYGM